MKQTKLNEMAGFEGSPDLNRISTSRVGDRRSSGGERRLETRRQDARATKPETGAPAALGGF